MSLNNSSRNYLQHYRTDCDRRHRLDRRLPTGPHSYRVRAARSISATAEEEETAEAATNNYRICPGSRKGAYPGDVGAGSC
jgi:hypothetical protein